jgi:enediyne biosynthesis protein E4
VGETSWNGSERKCLFANAGNGKFVDVARPLGADVTWDGRGVAVADLDGDGRQDLVMSNNNAAPTVFRNDLPPTGNWFRLTLAGRGGRGDAVGARATVKAGGALLRQVEIGGSYASQSEGCLHFGLGRATAIEQVVVTWPDGTAQTFTGPTVAGLLNRTARLTQGETTIPIRPPATAGLRR